MRTWREGGQPAPASSFRSGKGARENLKHFQQRQCYCAAILYAYHGYGNDKNTNAEWEVLWKQHLDDGLMRSSMYGA